MILLVTGLTACAGPKVWHKPGSDSADLSAAQRDCRERVLSEMRSDSYFRRERATEQFRRNDAREVGEASSARQRMQEFDSMKRRDSLFLECMQAKGYSRAERSPAS